MKCKEGFMMNPPCKLKVFNNSVKVCNFFHNAALSVFPYVSVTLIFLIIVLWVIR